MSIRRPTWSTWVFADLQAHSGTLVAWMEPPWLVSSISGTMGGCLGICFYPKIASEDCWKSLNFHLQFQCHLNLNLHHNPRLDLCQNYTHYLHPLRHRFLHPFHRRCLLFSHPLSWAYWDELALSELLQRCACWTFRFLANLFRLLLVWRDWLLRLFLPVLEEFSY